MATALQADRQWPGAETTVNDYTVMVNDAKIVKAEVLASNGVTHVIDTVLLPKY